MTQATGKRRGHREDSVYWDESKGRYAGAVSVGFSASEARLRKKVSGRTKTEVRDKLRELHQQVNGGLRPRRRGPWLRLGQQAGQGLGGRDMVRAPSGQVTERGAGDHPGRADRAPS